MLIRDTNKQPNIQGGARDPGPQPHWKSVKVRWRPISFSHDSQLLSVITDWCLFRRDQMQLMISHFIDLRPIKGSALHSLSFSPSQPFWNDFTSFDLLSYVSFCFVNQICLYNFDNSLNLCSDETISSSMAGYVIKS